mmetsp:Transcript_60652/g.105702  ORF Transcript_60652/g.105702 Transcript_60652/m.105702 type:complete len:642 (-) Transcript_60652:106-2031(-)
MAMQPPMGGGLPFGAGAPPMGGGAPPAQNPLAVQMMLQNLMRDRPDLAANPQLAQMLLQQVMMGQGQPAAPDPGVPGMPGLFGGGAPPPAASFGNTAPPFGGLPNGGGFGGSPPFSKAGPAPSPLPPAAMLPTPRPQFPPSSMSGGMNGGSSALPPVSSAPMPELPPMIIPPGEKKEAIEDGGDEAEKAKKGQTVEDDIIKIFDPEGNLIDGFQPLELFSQCPFPSSLQQEISKAGFVKPSQIQACSWPIALRGMDVVGVAATGSGKTIAFLFPSFMHILNNRIGGRDPTLLVLAPTRELAVQIEKEAQRFGSSSNLRAVCAYGGQPKGDQLRQMRMGCHCLIATPGRLNDFLEMKAVRLDSIAKLVLDEADRMLDMGFEPQIRKILKEVPMRRHTMFFTATWPKEVRKLAEDFLNKPWQVQIGNRDELKANQDITQIVKLVQSAYEKSSVLDRLMQEYKITQPDFQGRALVFAATKRMCDELERNLRRSVQVTAIHGDKDQRQRDEALDNFRSGRVKVMVATDVAARGLDIKGVVLVINFDPANNTEDYVHRVGRTGRAGQKGTAITLLTPDQAHKGKGILEVMQKTDQHISDELRAFCDSAPEKRKGKGKGKGKFDGGGGGRGGGFSGRGGGGGGRGRG